MPECHWLLIFDNADDINVLASAWPGDAKGSILITSRDPSVQSNPAITALQVTPFDKIEGTLAFLRLLGLSNPSEEERSIACVLTEKLGGLPLALKQISGFVIQQRLGLRKFLPLYERNFAKIKSKRAGPSDYKHTLSTVWELAISGLSGHASSLQSLLAYLDPDKIDEKLLTCDGKLARVDQFSFLTDEME